MGRLGLLRILKDLRKSRRLVMVMPSCFHVFIVEALNRILIPLGQVQLLLLHLVGD